MGFGNAQQSIPEVFKLIIENDKEQDKILAKEAAYMTIEDWKKLKSLRKYRRESLVPGAEKILRWNTDKGKAV